MASVDATSSEYDLMLPYWQKVSDILAGATKIRAAGKKYLPKYESEDETEYQRRLTAAPWRPEFADSLRALASKPFTQDLALVEPSERMKSIAEDVDARGNNLTVFARDVFRQGVAGGMHAILVDYPSMFEGATLADERRAGARPYWVSIPATDILALYTKFVGGREIVEHVRIREVVTERNGFDEIAVERIRVLEPGLWQLWESRESEWAMVSEGRMTLPEVPLALFYTGERKGAQLVVPPLNDLADMQIELYRALSRKDEIETYAGSPMLEGRGISAPGEGDSPVQVGPKRILFAPPGIEGGQTGWGYVQPNAANMKEIRDSVRELIQDMRRLGMQPMLSESGTVTATATSVETAKAHSALQAWALGLKDTLEQAFVFTAQWLNESYEPEVEINTDFAVDPYAQVPVSALQEARKNREITQRTYLSGLRRFGVLPSDLDVDKEIENVAGEYPADSEEDMLAAATPQQEQQEAA